MSSGSSSGRGSGYSGRWKRPRAWQARQSKRSWSKNRRQMAKAIPARVRTRCGPGGEASGRRRPGGGEGFGREAEGSRPVRRALGFTHGRRPARSQRAPVQGARSQACDRTRGARQGGEPGVQPGRWPAPPPAVHFAFPLLSHPSSSGSIIIMKVSAYSCCQTIIGAPLQRALLL